MNSVQITSKKLYFFFENFLLIEYFTDIRLRIGFFYKLIVRADFNVFFISSRFFCYIFEMNIK